MNVSRTENLPTPPGIINSIKAGFDTVAANITAILLPLSLNLFLWLGPRLRMDDMFNLMKDYVLLNADLLPKADFQKIVESYDQMIILVKMINLFWLLRTLPIGISSLFLSQSDSQTPLGSPAVLQVDSLSLFGWFFILTLAGWIGGGLYFRSVARLATANKDDRPMRVSRAIIQTMLVSIVWGIISLMIVVPLFIVLALLLQFNVFIANLFVLFLSVASMWLIVPLFFWPHGIFIKQQNFVTSIISSVQMARFTLPTSSLFVLTVFLLAYGLNFLWSIPPEDSWVTLLGIFGHSFVTTALLAGSFIYYRDMNNWLQNVIEKLRSATAVKQA